MRIGIGIDTGGTYTDIVAYDYETKSVIAKNKTLTTKEDLTLCISRSLDYLPPDVLASAVSISLSTTLATNACVEDRGGRGRVVLMGLPPDALERIGTREKYGLDPEEALCFDTGGSFDGTVVEIPDWEAVLAENEQWFSEAQSLAFSEVHALRNSAVIERSAREFFQERFDVPIVLASDLASELNFLERGATALLNARLLPVISAFVAAVSKVLADRNLDIPVMILRSDGSLMSKDLSRERPVETILSGPAASVIGGRGLSESRDCLIIDIGGTTTDISIVEKGTPVMTDSIKIGGWRTQVKGVFIDTYGLGGDSRVWVEKGQLLLEPQRVVPLCILASEHPEIVDSLRELVAAHRKTVYPMHEFLYMLREPESLDGYTDAEKRLLDTLIDAGRPVMIGGDKIDMYSYKGKRLEDEGVIMRSGLTPTDVMHLRGDFNRFDAEASRLAVRHFANSLFRVKDESELIRAMDSVCTEVYNLAKKKLYEYVMYALIEYRYPSIFKNGIDHQMRRLISQSWDNALAGRGGKLMDVGFDVNAALVGIGAPTHVFLPDVARVIGTECIIPEHAEVANAIGTAIANITARVSVEIGVNTDPGGVRDYVVRLKGGNRTFEAREEALAFAAEEAKRLAVQEARLRGAIGELTIGTEVEQKRVAAMYGDDLNLGMKVHAFATGKLNE